MMEPFVRVVVINFDGGQMTIDCLQSILATEWPADRLECVLVDNGSLDDVVERVREDLPSVRIIEPLRNTGFAGGCNLGIRAPGDFDVVALVNNDAVVRPGWLRPLVETLHAAEKTGAACPKILFEPRYLGVDLIVPGAAPPTGDGRTLGVCVTGALADGLDVSDDVRFDEGFFGPEPPEVVRGDRIRRWSWRRGSVRLPLGEASAGELPRVLTLRLSSARPRRVTIVSDERTLTVDVGVEPRWVDVPLGRRPFDVINNAGSSLYPGGFGGDRGFLQRDDGRFADVCEVFAWCGGAVALRKEYLDDVGLFDERLFLYYEDTDLSWRGRLRGWTYYYVPTSVVRHRHATSSVAGSETFRYYTERNRPLVLAKNAPAGLAVSAGLGLLRRFFRQVVTDLVRQVVRARMPIRHEVRRQRRVVTGYLALLPHAVRQRRRDRSFVRRSTLLDWTETKEVAR